ncbi:MAG: hypothetical protein HKO93_04290, partial [Flavobacteriales bacterium]|nr:hypothetical protein [Flavobacteriales bacterium]
MKVHGNNIDFPGTLHLSFAKLLDSLADELKTASPSRKEYLKSVLEIEKEHPGLRSGIDQAEITEYAEPISKLMELVFPESLTLNEIKCATPPWDFSPFHLSQRLKNLLSANGEEFNWEFDGFDNDQLYIAGCSTILGMYYHMPMKASRPFFIQLSNKETGKVRHYRMAFNVDFMEISPGEHAIEISKEDYHELIDNYHDIELWKKKFPVGSWKFSGFNILNMMDLTIDKNIGEIEKDLLNGGPEGLTRLQGHMSELLDIPDLKISFVSLDGDTLIQGGSYRMTSMMMSQQDEMNCKEMLCPYTYEELIVKDAPVAIPDVARFAKRSKSPIAQNVKKSGMKSYFICPIMYEEQKLGFLELGSEVKGALNATKYVILEEVIPVLAVSGNRYYQEKLNRLEAIIQEECTTIHPSVKWRFTQEAFKHIKAEDKGEKHTFKDLVFKDVYPLYGQLDIRGSSTMRNEAVQSDLLSQLTAVKSILEEVRIIDDIPIYEELLFVVDEYITEIQSSMNSTSEHIILNFLNKEIESLFPILKEKSKGLEEKIQPYLDSIDNEFHLLYQERRKFDESVNTMNKVLAAYLDDRQEEAQAMFPHYFERYKTDGVEFN